MTPPTGPSTRGLQLLAIPAVVFLISFQGYYTQYLFNTSSFGTGPLTTLQTITFNILLLCVWYTYYKSCTVCPGRYPPLPPSTSPSPSTTSSRLPPPPNQRYCRKCTLPKPPRAHHCRHCGRCIPKMDHHCPWTGNCVSLQTFPYFLRFLTYANLALGTEAYLISLRARVLWSERHLPSYLGPSLGSLISLAVLGLLCGGTMLALGILWGTTVKGWVCNQTMIEGWEAERHEVLVERCRRSSGGERVEEVEFPYDIGFFENMSQAMGTRNVFKWLWPFAGGPTVGEDGKGTGWEWEENGFNPRKGMWPPLDPEKARRAAAGVGWPGRGVEREGWGQEWESPEEAKRAFEERQREDWERRKERGNRWKSGIVAELEEEDELYDVEYEGVESDYEEGMDGEPGWTNSDGDRLRDYGVDEDLEDEDIISIDADDDIPLGELLRRRKVVGTDGG
ncbi:Palmitoyltransferase PFA4 [Coniochaeta hoffmannii]|uniref:Palmitoyltransferase PFA4 n=1 Tax=Coniochaeta hoffmannii TaxID=91930 RepID=A0AA38R7Q2_9PEZI|nr:Palmitoyltransferase PFA4 [Coniochaeta hoffmannii]